MHRLVPIATRWAQSSIDAKVTYKLHLYILHLAHAQCFWNVNYSWYTHYSWHAHLQLASTLSLYTYTRYSWHAHTVGMYARLGPHSGFCRRSRTMWRITLTAPFTALLITKVGVDVFVNLLQPRNPLVVEGETECQATRVQRFAVRPPGTTCGWGTFSGAFHTQKLAVIYGCK